MRVERLHQRKERNNSLSKYRGLNSLQCFYEFFHARRWSDHLLGYKDELFLERFLWCIGIKESKQKREMHKHTLIDQRMSP